ncbi:MAG: PAS domain-containing protein, partial [Chloroflexota bacterium]
MAGSWRFRLAQLLIADSGCRRTTWSARSPPATAEHDEEVLRVPETAQLSSLEQVALDIYASLDPAATIEAITRSSQRALGADRSTTYVSDEFGRIEAVHTTECITVIRRYLETAIQRPLEDTWVWATLAAQPDPVLAVEDVGATFGEPFRKRLGAKSFAGVRLEARGLTGDEVELLGSIFCAFRERHVFTAQEISALRMLGAIGSLALSNARMFAKTRRGLDEATARAEADAAFRLMTENSRDVIARCDADGTIRYMSPASLDVLGLEPDSAAGRHLPSLLGLASVDDLASEGAVVSRLPGAGEIWVETRARRVKTAPHTLEIQTAT